METLPIDILRSVFQYLDICEKLAVAMVIPRTKCLLPQLIYDETSSIWLSYAIIEHNNTMCKCILDLGWSVDFSNVRVAVRNNNLITLELIIFPIIDNNHKLLLICDAIESGSLDMVQQIIAHCDTKDLVHNDDNNMILHTLGANFNAGIANYIKSTNDAWFLSYIATTFGYHDMFIYFYDKHSFAADMNMAINGGSAKICKYLINDGINYGAGHANLAASYGDISILNMLLKNGCPIDNGLQIAAIDGGLDMFKYVYSIKNVKNPNVVSAVFRSDNVKIMNYIVENNWPIDHGLEVSLTGLKYLHERMNFQLRSEMYNWFVSKYYSHVNSNVLEECIGYLVANKTPITPDIIDEISHYRFEYKIWKLIHTAEGYCNLCEK